MVTWEDGISICKATESIQLQTIVMVQLDAGLRPSEFVDLNYGDVERKKDVMVLSVNGKTGARQVIIYDSVPYLNKWLLAHPTKKKKDPLWISEAKKKFDTIQRYSYDAIRMRLFKIKDKIKFKKPIDFYNLRHSACTLSKKENLNPEFAAKKFGHSVEYYVNTYGRLTTDDDIERLRKHKGLQQEQIEKAHTITCSKCDFVNKPKSEICEKCSSPLSLKKALEMDPNNKLQKELDDMKNQMQEINKVLKLKSLAGKIK